MTERVPEWIHLARTKWHYRGGQERPAFAQIRGNEQESVWDYPRPPCLVPDHRRMIVRAQGKVLAATSSALRILETASPPTFYLPPGDVDVSGLVLTGQTSFCEWKGTAQYFALREWVKQRTRWPGCIFILYSEFEGIAGYFSFYPGRLECYIDDERVRPQAGGFYGGWVTKEIVGPFKGSTGASGW